MSPNDQAHRALAEVVGELSLSLLPGRGAKPEDYERWLVPLRRIVRFFEAKAAAGKQGALL